MSIGDTLAEARRQSGLTVAQVSERTRIRESIIQSVEQDDYAPCGGDFYARGHIRSIAAVVGTDPVPLVASYDAEHGDLGGLRAAEVFGPATPIRIREPRRLRLGAVLAVALVALVGFGAYHLVAGRGGPARPAAAATVRPLVKAPPPPVKAAAKKSTAKKGTAKKGEAVITLSAVTDCWVGLHSASGRTIYAGTVPAGQTMTWTEKHLVSLVLGNPPGVKLTVNGKTEKTDTVQVLTLSIDPQSKTPVTVG